MESQRSDASPEERLRELTGLEDEALLRELIAAGIDADTAHLLPMFPLLRVGWASGKLEPAERERILELFPAHVRERRPVAAARLERWLDERPPDRTFEAVERALGQLLAASEEGARVAVQIRELCPSSQSAGSSKRTAPPSTRPMAVFTLGGYHGDGDPRRGGRKATKAAMPSPSPSPSPSTSGSGSGSAWPARHEPLRAPRAATGSCTRPRCDHAPHGTRWAPERTGRPGRLGSLRGGLPADATTEQVVDGSG